MTSLRAEIDRIIDQHFEPSTLGRIQAVDEIMAAVDTIRPRVTAALLAGPPTSGHSIAQQMVDAAPPITTAAVVEEILRSAPRPKRMDNWS